MTVCLNCHYSAVGDGTRLTHALLVAACASALVDTEVPVWVLVLGGHTRTRTLTPSQRLLGRRSSKHTSPPSSLHKLICLPVSGRGRTRDGRGRWGGGGETTELKNQGPPPPLPPPPSLSTPPDSKTLSSGRGRGGELPEYA